MHIFSQRYSVMNEAILSRRLIKSMVHIKIVVLVKILCHTQEECKQKEGICMMHSSKCLSWLCQCVRMCCALCKHIKHPVVWTTKTFIKHLRCLIMNVSYGLHAVYDRKRIQLCNSEYWWELIDACLRHNFHGLMLRKSFHARNQRVGISIIKHFILIELLN